VDAGDCTERWAETHRSRSARWQEFRKCYLTELESAEMDQPVAELIKFARRRKSMYFIEWQRLPADGIFIARGVVPLVIAALLTYFGML
jgi:hypothetical protein